MEQYITLKLSDLRRVVREEMRVTGKVSDEWITPSVWMNRTGKTRDQLSWVQRNYPTLSRKKKGVRCEINWTEYIAIYPISKAS